MFTPRAQARVSKGDTVKLDVSPLLTRGLVHSGFRHALLLIFLTISTNAGIIYVAQPTPRIIPVMNREA